jgi:hypothetical protein
MKYGTEVLNSASIPRSENYIRPFSASGIKGTMAGYLELSRSNTLVFPFWLSWLCEDFVIESLPVA